ncbi:hypothetical protein ACLD43_04570 [Clostridium botulinum]|uniref:hypothetical protein n=1 Tax=Clostridium botulinum TaxID=1491 RepID=UPI003A7F8705
MYIKIKNILQNNGIIDYKGLDINKFRVGSHGYNFENDFCIVETTEKDTVKFSDVEELNYEKYQKILNEIKAKEENNINPSKKQLEDEVNELKQAIAELSVQITMQNNLGGM